MHIFRKYLYILVTKKDSLCESFYGADEKLAKPRRKNCPLDSFCLNFKSTLTDLKFDHSFSSPLILVTKKDSLCESFYGAVGTT